MAPVLSFKSNAAAIARRVDAWSQNITPELAQATLKAATVITAAAKREAPVATGRLRRSISYQAGGEARYIVAPAVPYAVAVHNGSKPHIIRPTNKRALWWKGALHPVKSVRHPGNRANPFMTRALANSRPEIEQITADCGHQIITRQG